MISNAPDFINSPYLIIDATGWHLRADAPDDLKKKFKDYMDSLNMLKES
jgi:hypothetical protein